MDAEVYLVSPETAAISAINGYISDATDVKYEKAILPENILLMIR